MSRSHPLGRGIPPAWASAWGEDRYGVFATFTVDGTIGQGEAVRVEQRMRWIPPGTFWMGSPESEPGRFDDELQHRVTLTRGFWLADTPCTQALWGVVTGETPSDFRDPLRPVEQVSWEDVAAFLPRLAERAPELDPRLPTEAEWERACRAEGPNAERATWVGDLEIVGSNHARGLGAIAWYGGNCGAGFDLAEGVDTSEWPEKEVEHERGGTRRVATRPPNPFGLYDMLGNVYEWCGDWYGRYPSEPVADPPGAVEGVDRVLRGGSWNAVARYVRAAYRLHHVPGYRFDYLGFRLARGQE